MEILGVVHLCSVYFFCMDVKKKGVLSLKMEIQGLDYISRESGYVNALTVLR